MPELTLVEVRLSPPQRTPVVVLKEVDGPRHLAIWMSATSASAVVTALEDRDPVHPGTHDLMVVLLEELGQRLQAVVIIGEEDGEFFAQLVLDNLAVPARPSDALALALRWGAPIRCTEIVLARAGIDFAAQSPPESGLLRPDDEVEQFRVFLDSVNPDDFES